MENVELGPVTTRVVHLVARFADRMQSQKFNATAEMQLLAIENVFRPANDVVVPFVQKPLSTGERREQDDLASIRSALYADRSA
jgi:hypothetical protein